MHDYRDRGYGKSVFMEAIARFGLGAVFVMPDHLTRAHPFIATSYLNPHRGDLDTYSGAQDRSTVGSSTNPPNDGAPQGASGSITGAVGSSGETGNNQTNTAEKISKVVDDIRA